MDGRREERKGRRKGGGKGISNEDRVKGETRKNAGNKVRNGREMEE